MHKGEKLTRIRTVERVPGWGWIARCPFSGLELFEPGFVWNSRSVARDVVEERRRFGRDEAWEARQRATLKVGLGECIHWAETEDQQFAERKEACLARRKQYGNASCEEKDGSCSECEQDMAEALRVDTRALTQGGGSDGR